MRKPNRATWRQNLVNLLRSRHAHLNFDEVMADWPVKLRGAKPRGAPHTAWQLLEHMRIAQWDILDFCRNPNYKYLKFEDYWPKAAVPPDKRAWEQSLKAFRSDRKAMEKLVVDPSTDLLAPIPHGRGQTILRETLVVADHNAYHLGQLLLLRRLLGGWPRRRR